MSKKIFANNDKNAYTIVDDDVFETIQEMKLKFCITKDGYFQSTSKIQLSGMEKKKHLLLHRFVFTLKTGTEPSSTVDHADIDKLNNQFSNLRLATRQEQSQHRGRMKNNKSGYIGVYHKHNVDQRNNKKYENDYWKTSIMRPDRKLEQKYFPYTEAGKIAAAKFYDKKAIEYFGDFHGELNFPSDKDK